MTHLDVQVPMRLSLKRLLYLPAILTCADTTCRNVIIKQQCHVTVTGCWACLKCYELTH